MQTSGECHYVTLHNLELILVIVLFSSEMLYKYTYLLDTCTVQPMVDIEEIQDMKLNIKLNNNLLYFQKVQQYLCTNYSHKTNDITTKNSIKEYAQDNKNVRHKAITQGRPFQRCVSSPHLGQRPINETKNVINRSDRSELVTSYWLQSFGLVAKFKMV